MLLLTLTPLQAIDHEYCGLVVQKSLKDCTSEFDRVERLRKMLENELDKLQKSHDLLQVDGA